MSNKLTIGIDPDVNKSGIAVFHPDKKLAMSNLSFFELQDYFVFHRDNIHVVKVEAGYLNLKSNWHNGNNIRTAARVGKNVGACNEVAKKIVEMCNHYHIPVKEIKPLPKIWKGHDRKITDAELKYQLKSRGIAHVNGRTNQEMRDAALICLLG